MSKTNQIKVKQHKANSKVTGAIIPLTSITNPQSGLTIVFRRTGPRMVGVSLAWCAPEDTFKRKIGIDMACRDNYFGEAHEFQFQVPMPGATDEQIVFQLTSMFDQVDFSPAESWHESGIYGQNDI